MESKPSRWRWFMIGLVFWATVINYLDRQTLSVAAPVLREEFGMSNVAYSRVVFAFLLAYTIMNGVSGPLIDRLGTRLGYALCMAWWSAAAVVHALAKGPWSLGVARFLLGMGEAGNWPGGVKVVAEWFPPKERALFRAKFVWVFTLSKIFMDPVWYFYIFWFPEYLKSSRNFDMASIGRYAWIPFLVAGFGNLLGGMLSAAMLSRGWSLTVSRKISVSIFAALMVSAIPAVLVPNVWISIALVSLAMVGYTGSSANMLAFPADVFPKNTVGSVYGLASMGSGFGGMLFTLITGWMVDSYSYRPVFFMFGVMPLVCSVILWLWLGPIEKGAAGWKEEKEEYVAIS